MLRVVPLHKILHDGTRLEQVDRFAVRKRVRQSGNTAVGVDGEKPWLLLGILRDVDLFNLVGEAACCRQKTNDRRLQCLAIGG